MRKQLQALRDRMAEHDLQAYLIPTADPHGSEYVGGHFACREYISGFTGSAGTLLVFPTGRDCGPTGATSSRPSSSCRTAASA